MIMFFYGEIRFREDPYSDIFYVVLLLLNDMLISEYLICKINLKDGYFSISIYKLVQSNSLDVTEVFFA